MAALTNAIAVRKQVFAILVVDFNNLEPGVVLHLQTVVKFHAIAAAVTLKLDDGGAGEGSLNVALDLLGDEYRRHS